MPYVIGVGIPENTMYVHGDANMWRFENAEKTFFISIIFNE
jgi:hypothetical protein